MSAGSGIAPNSATLALVEELRRNNSKYVFGLFKVVGTEVVPDTQFPNNDDEAKLVAGYKKAGDVDYAAQFKTTIWNKFLSAIEKADGPRFCVIDFNYVTTEGRIVKQLVVVSFCSDKGTSARIKMAFASTKTAFETKINVGKKYQANDIADLGFEQVFEYIKSH